jgi:2,4-didehydro-3-deoxy-L-rhamnonate hydrolase
MVLRLVNYVTRGAEAACGCSPSVGAIVDNTIIPLAEHCLWPEGECGCGDTLVSLLGCPRCLARVRQMISELGESQIGLPMHQVKLLSPVPNPGKLFCVAGNYEEHIRESKGKNLSGEVHESDRATPRIFMKPSTNTVCGPDDPILVTPSSTFVDYEGELLVIIAHRGKYLTPETALDIVGGVTCCNDISERRLQIWDRPETRPWDRFFDWLNGKWFDNSAPMGPCAVPLSDLPDVQNLALATRLNGETVQESSTAAMIFSVAELIAYLSQMVTLEPGDVIATGTPAGVGVAREINLKPGDVVEVEIEGIGMLRNSVAAEPILS